MLGIDSSHRPQCCHTLREPVLDQVSPPGGLTIVTVRPHVPTVPAQESQETSVSTLSRVSKCVRWCKPIHARELTDREYNLATANKRKYFLIMFLFAAAATIYGITLVMKERTGSVSDDYQTIRDNEQGWKIIQCVPAVTIGSALLGHLRTNGGFLKK